MASAHHYDRSTGVFTDSEGRTGHDLKYRPPRPATATTESGSHSPLPNLVETCPSAASAASSLPTTSVPLAIPPCLDLGTLLPPTTDEQNLQIEGNAPLGGPPPQSDFKLEFTVQKEVGAAEIFTDANTLLVIRALAERAIKAEHKTAELEEKLRQLTKSPSEKDRAIQMLQETLAVADRTINHYRAKDQRDEEKFEQALNAKVDGVLAKYDQACRHVHLLTKQVESLNELVKAKNAEITRLVNTQEVATAMIVKLSAAEQK